MKRALLGTILAAGLLAGFGCSGGGGTTTAPLPNAPGTTAPQTANSKVTLAIPVAAAHATGAKRPAYVSAATQSVTFSIGGTLLSTVQLTPLPNASCPLSGSYYVCTVPFAAPVGNSTLTIATYATTGGTGTPLSINAIPVDIQLDQANVVSASLNGVVATLTLSLSQNTVTNGAATSFTAVWGGLDAAGNIIVGPGALVDANNNPITPSLGTSDVADYAVGTLTGTAFPVTFNANNAAGTTLTLSASGFSSVAQSVTTVASPAPSATNAVANGDFTSSAFDGTASWYRCYANRITTAGSAPIGASPAPVNQLTVTAGSTAPPTPGAATDVSQQSTTPSGTPPPSANAHFALVGYSGGAGLPQAASSKPNKGNTGICQDIPSIPSAASLTFNIYEGGDDNWSKSDSEADLYPAGTFTGTNPGFAGPTAAPIRLMAENNCYDSMAWEKIFLNWPAGGGTGSVALSTTARWSGCPETPGGISPGAYSPSSGGGVWYAKSISLASYAGQAKTLFLGISRDAGASVPTASGAQYYNYAFYDHVQMNGTTGAASPALTVAPNPLAVTETGAMTLTASETGYAGSLTVTSDNPAVITATSPATAGAGSATIHVNVVNAGFANLTIKDASNQTVVVPVTVTLTPVYIQ